MNDQARTCAMLEVALFKNLDPAQDVHFRAQSLEELANRVRTWMDSHRDSCDGLFAIDWDDYARRMDGIGAIDLDGIHSLTIAPMRERVDFMQDLVNEDSWYASYNHETDLYMEWDTVPGDTPGGTPQVIEFRIVDQPGDDCWQFWLPDYYDQARRERWPKDEDGPALKKHMEMIAWSEARDRFVSELVSPFNKMYNELQVPVKGSQKEDSDGNDSD